MKSFPSFSEKGPVLFLSKRDSVMQPELMSKLASYGKFIAYELPVESVRACYSAKFGQALKDSEHTDEFRVLDDDVQRIFLDISLKELGPATVNEPKRRSGLFRLKLFGETGHVAWMAFCSLLRPVQLGPRRHRARVQ